MSENNYVKYCLQTLCQSYVKPTGFTTILEKQHYYKGLAGGSIKSVETRKWERTVLQPVTTSGQLYTMALGFIWQRKPPCPRVNHSMSVINVYPTCTCVYVIGCAMW